MKDLMNSPRKHFKLSKIIGIQKIILGNKWKCYSIVIFWRRTRNLVTVYQTISSRFFDNIIISCISTNNKDMIFNNSYYNNTICNHNQWSPNLHRDKTTMVITTVICKISKNLINN